MADSNYLKRISTTESETRVAPAVVLATVAVVLILLLGIAFRLVTLVL